MERNSVRGIFKYAWEARIILAIAKAAFTHLMGAMAKLDLTEYQGGAPLPKSKRDDPLLNAGVFFLRSSPPSQWGGREDSFSL